MGSGESADGGKCSSDPVVVLVDGLLHDVVFLHLVLPSLFGVDLFSDVRLVLVFLSYSDRLHSLVALFVRSSVGIRHESLLLESDGLSFLVGELLLLLLLRHVQLHRLFLVPLGDGHSLLLVAKEGTSPVFVDLVHLSLLVGNDLSLLLLLHLGHGIVLVPDVSLDGSVKNVALHCN